jgi:hypothetical protein
MHPKPGLDGFTASSRQLVLEALVDQPCWQ